MTASRNAIAPLQSARREVARRCTRCCRFVLPTTQPCWISSRACRRSSSSRTCCSARSSTCSARRRIGRNFKALIATHRDKIRQCMLTHATQTNEAARCATLLPVLAQLPQPLALLEVGASAGLCLQPDRYAYDYGDGRVLRPPGHDDAPVLPCEVNAADAGPDAIARDRVACGPRSQSDRRQRPRAVRVAGSTGVAGAARPAGTSARSDRDCAKRSAAAGARQPAARSRAARGAGAKRCDAGDLPLRGACLCLAAGIARAIRARCARAECGVDLERDVAGVSVDRRQNQRTASAELSSRGEWRTGGVDRPSRRVRPTGCRQRE